MIIENKILTLDTNKRFEFIDITKNVESFIAENSFQNGQVLVYSKHTTMAITINEKEKGIFSDAEEFFKRILPEHLYYKHNDFDIRTENMVCDRECKNGDSHLQHLLLGTSETLPIQNGKIVFGPWQKILAIELDGPRKKRQIHLQFIGQ